MMIQKKSPIVTFLHFR